MRLRLAAAVLIAFAGTLAGCHGPPPRAPRPADTPHPPRDDGRPLVPETFGDGWTRAAPPREFVAGDLFNHINGGAELFLELGFARVQVARYGRDAAQLGLEVYEMRSPTAARALFYHFRGPGVPFPGALGRNVGNPSQILAQKGRHYVQVSNFTARPGLEHDMAALAVYVWEVLPDDEPVPLLDRLPAPGRVGGSERIVRGPYGLQALYELGAGDVLQLAGEHFGVAADYDDGAGNSFTRLIIGYGTPAAAAAAFGHATANLDPYSEILAQSERRLVFRDYEGRFGVIRLDGATCDLRLRLPVRP